MVLNKPMIGAGSLICLLRWWRKILKIYLEQLWVYIWNISDSEEPKGAELDGVCADLTLWHKNWGVCFTRMSSITFDTKDLLRDALGSTMSASLEVVVGSGLMYLVWFLHLQRRFGRGSATKGWLVEDLSQRIFKSVCHIAQLLKDTIHTVVSVTDVFAVV